MLKFMQCYGEKKKEADELEKTISRCSDQRSKKEPIIGSSETKEEAEKYIKHLGERDNEVKRNC